jgi:hypothetical protein
MVMIRGFPQGLLNNIIGAAPNNAVGTAPQQAVAAPVQAPPPTELERISSGKIIGYTNEGEQGSPIYEQFLKDPKTGDLYESITSQNYDSEGMISSYNYNPGRLLATDEALNNLDIQNLTNSYNWRGISNPGEKYTDPDYAVSLFNLKQQNPDQYYKTLATDISDQILGNWSMNKNEHNVALTNQLESIKDVNPAAYYQAQLNLLSKQSGWQHGQNTFERAKPYQEKMTELAPKALEAGLSAQQIDSIVGQGFSAASAQNQQRIVNEQQSGGGGFNLGELVRGVLPVAALAIGGPLLDAALVGGAAAGAAGTGGAAGGTAAGTGLTGGFGGSTGLLASGGTVGSLGGAGSAAGIAATQAAAGLGITAGSALPALGMATGGFPSTVGQLSAALPAQGSVGGAGLGLSAELAPGTILGSGLPGGGAIGASYALGANGLPATGLLGQPIPASSVGFGSIPNTVTSGLSIGISDALNAARLGRGLLGGQQQPTPQAAAPRPQNIMPRGQVDYSGILNLLQVPSPQRNMYSLLG